MDGWWLEKCESELISWLEFNFSKTMILIRFAGERLTDWLTECLLLCWFGLSIIHKGSESSSMFFLFKKRLVFLCFSCHQSNWCELREKCLDKFFISFIAYALWYVVDDDGRVLLIRFSLHCNDKCLWKWGLLIIKRCFVWFMMVNSVETQSSWMYGWENLFERVLGRNGLIRSHSSSLFHYFDQIRVSMPRILEVS